MDNYGTLLKDSDIKLHRKWFVEMTNLIGVKVIHRAPRESKTYNGYGELDNYFYEPELVGCIFEETPNQRTMKKLGWVTEVDTNASIISVPYDLSRLQVGSIFIIPSGIDNSEGRVFRVSKMSVGMIYPSSVTCELVPEYANTCEQSQVEDFTSSDFNLLKGE